MADTIIQSAPQPEAEQERTLNQMFTEMQHLNDIMHKDEVAIERLKGETSVLRAETRSILARLGETL